MINRSSNERVAVVGAGPGGLSAALLLAARGAEVHVFESAPEIGGRTSRITLPDPSGRESFAFDRGPTFFLMPYVLEEIFAAAGRRLSDEVELTRLDPMYRLLLGREGDPRQQPWRVDATQDVREMARRLSAIDPADGANFEKFISDNRAKLRLMEPVLRSPMRSVADIVTSASPKFLPHLNPHLSVNGLLERYFRNKYVRLSVSFQSKYLGMSPMDCPSIFTILPFIEYEYGVWHPKGGCNALMHAMARVLRELGGQIHLGAPVAGLQYAGRKITGLRVRDPEGRERVESFSRVVVNADAAAAIRRFVPESLRPSGWRDEQIDRKRYSCSTYMLYLGVRGRVDLPHHTIFVSSKYEQNLADITSGGCLSDDPSVYICNPAPIDPSLAPAGDSALYVLMPTPNLKPVRERGRGSNGGNSRSNASTSDDWATLGASAREVVLNQIEHRFGIRDIRSRIVVEKAISPADWQAGIDGLGPIQFGATFNLAHNLGQMLHKRVQHRLPSVEGLYFVGGGTHPGSGLPVIFLSSQIAADLAANDMGLESASKHESRAAAQTAESNALAGAAR